MWSAGKWVGRDRRVGKKPTRARLDYNRKKVHWFQGSGYVETRVPLLLLQPLHFFWSWSWLGAGEGKGLENFVLQPLCDNLSHLQIQTCDSETPCESVWGPRSSTWMGTLGTWMGKLWDLKRPSGPWCCFQCARSHILWLTDLYLCRHIWSENGHPYVARTGSLELGFCKCSDGIALKRVSSKSSASAAIGESSSA